MSLLVETLNERNPERRKVYLHAHKGFVVKHRDMRALTFEPKLDPKGLNIICLGQRQHAVAALDGLGIEWEEISP